MIPRLIHQFTGTAGDYTNVVPDYTDDDSSGVVLSAVRLDANGLATKGLNPTVTGLPAIPSGFVRSYQIGIKVDPSVTYLQYGNGIGMWTNYVNDNNRWGLYYREEADNSGGVWSSLGYWDGATESPIARTTALNGGNANPYWGRFEVIEAGDYLFAYTGAFGFYNTMEAGSVGGIRHRVYQASRTNKAVTTFQLYMGWGTDHGWAKVSDLRIIDLPEIL